MPTVKKGRTGAPGQVFLRFLFCISTTVVCVSSFNLKTESPIALRPPDQKGIQFGFSLAYFLNGTEKTLLVGAPRAQTPQPESNPGALYSCSLKKLECDQLVVDDKSDRLTPWFYDEQKGNQGLGYSLAANNESITVCAPRWHIFDSRQTGVEDLALGKCFTARAPEFVFTPFCPPILTKPDKGLISFRNTGYCQFGFSLTYIKNQNSVAAGGPGCWNWQGDVWDVQLDRLDDTETYRYVEYLSLDDMDLARERNSTSSTLSNLYLGYNVIHFTYGEYSAIAATMPKAISTANLVVGPLVQILVEDAANKNRLRVIDSLKPPRNQSEKKEASKESMFSYYGYSLATADLNGDSLDDIIVGAPFYHNNTHQDQGAIFVYMQNRFSTGGETGWSYEMLEEQNGPLRMGTESNGRFGTCVTNIGDIDDDGYQDIAVGAPFLPEGGAVYIYMGSSKGLEEMYRQVIKASELPAYTQPISGLGFSIAQNLPGGKNIGTQLAIAAYDSDIVLVFELKEVITVDWSLTFNPKVIDLTEKNCIDTSETSAEKSYPCVQMKACLQYSSTKLSSSPPSILYFTLNVDVDVEQTPRRLFFKDGATSTQLNFELRENEKICQDVSVMEKKSTLEEVKPYIIQGEIEMAEKDKSEAILDPRSDLIKTVILDIWVPCENSTAGSCLSKLQLMIEEPPSYSLQDQPTINVSFTARNPGEPAYNVWLHVDAEGDLLFQSLTESVSCDEKREVGTICNVARVLTNESEVKFVLSMATTRKFVDSLETHENYFRVNASLSTSAIIVNPEDARRYFEIPIAVEAELDITRGASSTPQVKYNSSEFYKQPHKAEREEELGPEVIHVYKIFNNKAFDIYSTEISILWPLKFDGLYFLYLLEMPKFHGANISCKYTGGEVNEFNLKKDVETLAEPDEYGDFFQPSLEISGLPSPPQHVHEKKIQYLTFQCIIGALLPRTYVNITLRSRLVERSLTELQMGNSIKDANSFSWIRILKLPLQAPLPPRSNATTVQTIISYQNESPEASVAWWIYLLAALGGLTVLILIIIILQKIGFFKRKSFDEMDGDKAEGDNLVDEEKGEEEKEEENPKTPESPMLKETERADGDFEFHRS
ncbi:integrin alpha-8-like isoform X2 [Palaemon carinicauda]|uniref:integrin alpha-8-like isoform X2 n=1 Tax=Palaemon carinicauda TaxID=392227 RepID=UPI0035B624CE